MANILGHGSAMGGIQWGPAADGDNVYAALSDLGFRRGPSGSPGARQGPLGTFTLDPRAGGGLFALKLTVREPVWAARRSGLRDGPGCSPAQSAAVTVIPGVVFSGSIGRPYARVFDYRRPYHLGLRHCP